MSYRARAYADRHPEWWLLVLAALAWLALAAAELGSLFGPDAAGHLGTHHGHPVAPSERAANLAPAALMSVAMMSPLATPLLRHVMLSSLWDRRARSGLLFMAGYVSVWTAVGFALAWGAAAAARIASPPLVTAVVFAAAAAWQLSGAKQRSLRRCGLTLPLAPSGWRADWDSFRFGLVASRPCVATCWALMAAAVVAGHALLPMAALFVLQLCERLTLSYTSTRAAAAVAIIGALAVGTTLVTGTGAR